MFSFCVFVLAGVHDWRVSMFSVIDCVRAGAGMNFVMWSFGDFGLGRCPFVACPRLICTRRFVIVFGIKFQNRAVSKRYISLPALYG